MSSYAPSVNRSTAPIVGLTCDPNEVFYCTNSWPVIRSFLWPVMSSLCEFYDCSNCWPVMLSDLVWILRLDQLSTHLSPLCIYSFCKSFVCAVVDLSCGLCVNRLAAPMYFMMTAACVDQIGSLCETFPSATCSLCESFDCDSSWPVMWSLCELFACAATVVDSSCAPSMNL